MQSLHEEILERYHSESIGMFQGLKYWILLNKGTYFSYKAIKFLLFFQLAVVKLVLFWQCPTGEGGTAEQDDEEGGEVGGSVCQTVILLVAGV